MNALANYRMKLTASAIGLCRPETPDRRPTRLRERASVISLCGVVSHQTLTSAPVYRHCIFCQTSLETNEVIEAFPIGSRLAFDPDRGRLWVVCRTCERWNLTPLEERWEAVEACERLFRSTRLRQSTSNIGLARIPPGLELIRIGTPLRPELAAWRYGDQFGRRHRRHLVTTGAALLLLPAVYFSATLALGLTGLGGVSWQLGSLARNLYRRRRILGTATLPSGHKVPLTAHMASSAALRHRVGRPWALELPHRGLLPTPDCLFEGEAALAVARVLLPLVNRAGAPQKAVKAAVQRIEHMPELDYWLTTTATYPGRSWTASPQRAIARQPIDVRLAIEMLLHEDLERRAVEGELWRLERAWQAAEEVAAIADALLLPEDIATRLGSFRPPSDG
jgi:hypothetical protein